ncbi:MAG: NfeD family protein [Kiritimatiellia bacterium]|jgi:membrane-bound serine protease (ClpP class)|nr:NfeD family protein [Kiritimatiellia bacterium]
MNRVLSIKWLLLLLALLAGIPAAAQSPPAPVAAQSPVYVIPIRGQIEGALLYVIRRGLAEAERQGAAAVLLVLDTPGGTLNAASDIVRSIQAAKTPVHSFVEKDAFSAGAIIALATRSIYMAPGAVIGDALPIMVSPIGGVQEMPEGLEEKSVSAVSALVRAAAQAAGHDPELAEKMVRREKEYTIGEEVISPAGQLLTLTAEEAARPGREEGKALLSAGTQPDIEAVLEALGLAGHPIVEMDITVAERVARLIAAAAPILMILGFLGIYLEIKTPGIGLPGIFGAICLALFFWGHHIAGLAGQEDLLIFAAGVLLILVEIFIIPGFGITGLLGISLVLISLVGAMTRIIPGGPVLPEWPDVQLSLFKTGVAIVGTGGAILVLGRFLPRNRFVNRLALATSTAATEGYTAADNSSALVGLTGTALTPLRPAGAARIDGQRRDVVTAGEFIEAGTPIQIVEAHGSRLVVGKAPAP